MKRALIILSILSIGIAVKAEVKFAYEAGAEVVSAYLWRGMYNGGLSFQPNVSVGFDHKDVQFQFGVWGNVGASDWKFTKGLEQEEGYNPNTYFVPEVDIVCSLRSHGVTVGFSHYYYCSGPYFNFGDIEKAVEGKSQTEVTIGIDGDDWLSEEHHAYINWYTMVSGADGNFEYDEDGNVTSVKRAYSSYLELGYDYTFSNVGITLGAQLGIVPWRSDWVYSTEGAALKCVSLKLNKAWDLDVCEIDLFAQGMIDTYDINKENAYINLSGDDKLCCQKLNGTIGLGIWF